MSLTTTSKFNVDEIRKQFPVLDQEVNGKPLIYFDNAATAQKPVSVIKALEHYYQNDNANIHRGIHTLAERATSAYEETRKNAAAFINANESEEVVFTKGTTEGINLVAQSYGRKFLKKGDEVLISGLEHHSNIVPWQIVCSQTEAKLKVIEVDDAGELDMEDFGKKLSEKTRIVAVNYISNTLGTVNPIKEIAKNAHEAGAVILVDGAQAAPHAKIDVKELNIDFLAISSHKMYGPTGVGVLYGKRNLLEKMDPYQGGGEMIKEVSFEGTTYNDIPYKFEAGTPNIADVIAFHRAMDFVLDIGYEAMHDHENELLLTGVNLLSGIDGFIPVGTARKKASVISFNIEGVHHFDLGMMLDAKGIAVRTGHHCTQPLMDRYGIEGTVRASFAVYNTTEEIENFVNSLRDITTKLRK